MVSIAAQMLEADVVTIDYRMPSRIAQALSVLRRRDRTTGDESCLMVCSGPGDLLKLLHLDQWRRRYKFIAAWVIDSFWTTHISSIVKLAGPFDQFLVTSIEDVELWMQITGVPTCWLPWGADVLGGGAMAAQRDWDLTRVGRQPPEWVDDAGTEKVSEQLGIRFRGRPPTTGLTNLENQRFLMEAYANSKYVLAFSNSVNPELYTHPTRQYVTGRWVDSLACGATVAGIRPRSETVDALLWPGATLEFPSTRRGEGLAVLAGAIASWKPELAAHHYRMALQKLDWRWRFESLATLFGVSPQALKNDLSLLRARISALDAT
ncbi:MAG TPA: hypothetical protein VGM97_07970 [Steroidobacteraceae bacterium]|jgi:hypothetical protein